jgi:hypothetical protein
MSATRKLVLAALAVILCCCAPLAPASAQTQVAKQRRGMPASSPAPDLGSYSNRYLTETIDPSTTSTIGCGRCGFRPMLSDSSVLKYPF